MSSKNNKDKPSIKTEMTLIILPTLMLLLIDSLSSKIAPALMILCALFMIQMEFKRIAQKNENIEDVNEKEEQKETT